MIKRKLANASYPVLDITRDENNNITITTSAPFTRATTTFKLNEEFDEQRLDGKVVKSTVEQQGNKFIQTQTDGSLVIKYIREFAGDEIRVVSGAEVFLFCFSEILSRVFCFYFDFDVFSLLDLYRQRRLLFSGLQTNGLEKRQNIENWRFLNKLQNCISICFYDYFFYQAVFLLWITRDR